MALFRCVFLLALCEVAATQQYFYYRSGGSRWTGGEQRRESSFSAPPTKGPSHYETLGIRSASSEEDIRHAYRSLAKKLHPDKNKDDPDAQEKFTKLAAAYEVLSDPSSRRDYDDSLRWSQGQGQGGGGRGGYGGPGSRGHRESHRGSREFANAQREYDEMMRMHFEYMKRFGQTQQNSPGSRSYSMDFRLTLSQLMWVTLIALGGVYIIFNATHPSRDVDEGNEEEETEVEDMDVDGKKSSTADKNDAKSTGTLQIYNDYMKSEKGKILLVACSQRGRILVEGVARSGSFATDPIVFTIRGDVDSSKTQSTSRHSIACDRDNAWDVAAVIRGGSKWRGFHLDKTRADSGSGIDIRTSFPTDSIEGTKILKSWIEKILLGELIFNANDTLTPCPV